MRFSDDIRRNRFFNFSFKFESFGKPVSIRLQKHKFLFGCNTFGILDIKEEDTLSDYKAKYKKLFNAGTLPFYWALYEPDENKPNEQNLLNAAKWCKENNITVKGHPLCWHTLCADWLLKYRNNEILEKQMKRIEREVTAFKGFIDIWDVINEAVIMPVFDRYDNAVTRLAEEYGSINLVLKCFKKAKEINPDSYLLINDFNHSKNYEILIEELLLKDCPIDAIGIQTHQHQGYHGTEYVADVLERFSRFGNPIHFTENTILSGELAPAHLDDLNDAAREEWPSTPEGEELQAEQAVEMYSQIFAHPGTEALVWWDFADGNWLNAPSGLLRRDFSEKPAYKKLKDLINNDWGFPEKEVKPDVDGNIRIYGPEGIYAVKTRDKEEIIILDRKHNTH